MKTEKIRSMLINLAVIILFLSALCIIFYYYCIHMPGSSHEGPLPGTDNSLRVSAERLREHVRYLADEIGERHAWKSEALERTAQYIEEEFTGMQYVPKSEVVNNRNHRNIIVDVYGNRFRDRIIVIGAHYDTVPMSPGADDNASGIAALLEIARAFHKQRPSVTLRFTAFVNEEEPFYGRDSMGSLFNARRSKERGENIIGMYSLEMLGYFSDSGRSQYYPRIVRHFYPNIGNFIAFVGNLKSRRFLHDSILSFRKLASFPSEGLVAPQVLVPDIRRSDNAAFWFHGFPAVMITDTSNFRNWNYHTPGDKYETLDYERMAVVVDGLTRMLEAMAQRYAL